MSSNRHEPPTGRRGSAAPAKHDLLGDEERLYTAHADKLRRVVGAAVHTSEANIEDACSFAWLQLLCDRPRRESVFAWLATVATRKAWRLHWQCARDAHGDDLAALTDARRTPRTATASIAMSCSTRSPRSNGCTRVGARCCCCRPPDSAQRRSRPATTSRLRGRVS